MMFFKVYYLKTRSYGISRTVRRGFISAVIIACLLIGVGLAVYFLIPRRESRTGPDSKDTKNWLRQIEPSESELGNYSMAAVSTDAAPCAQVGREILEMNGTAVDAAIATLLCMGVAIPHSMGIGGGCLMTIYDRKNRTVLTLDSREKAPKRASENMFSGSEDASQTGGLAVGVPGEVKGYEVAHSRYGRLPWEVLFQPAIQLATEGIPVSRHLANALKQNREIILQEDSLRKVFVSSTTEDVLKEGDILRRLDLAETLKTLSKGGADELYNREKQLAIKLVQDIKSFGGIVDLDDLEEYEPLWRRVVHAEIAENLTMYSIGTPGSGDLLGFMLNVMGGFNLTEHVGESLSSTVLMYHRMVETFKFAYARRMELGDEDFDDVKELVQNLTSKEFADAIGSAILDNQTFNDPAHYGFEHYFDDDHGTAHVSVIDAEGNAVSIGTTVNLYFGSKRISSQTGILLNDQMDDFASPNITNWFKVPPAEANRIRPGKRPLSSMSPAIVINETSGDAVLVIGGNGGTQITTSMVSVILGSLLMGQDIKEAIDQPRLHHQLFPNHISYEKEFSQEILGGLRRLGHQTEAITGRSGIILAIMRGKDGRLYANSDYRKGGKTDGF